MFVTCPCGVLGQVCNLIVSISDLCLLSYIAMLIKKLNMICLVYSDKVFVFMCVHYLSLFCCVLTMLALCHPMKSWESLCPCHLLAPLNRFEGMLKGGLGSMWSGRGTLSWFGLVSTDENTQTFIEGAKSEMQSKICW